MKKYVCTACGYIYDPAQGDPDTELNREQPLRHYLMTGFVLPVALRNPCLQQEGCGYKEHGVR